MSSKCPVKSKKETTVGRFNPENMATADVFRCFLGVEKAACCMKWVTIDKYSVSVITGIGEGVGKN